MRRLNVPAWISLFVTFIGAGIVALGALETYLLATHQAPITWFTECSIAAFPLWWLLAVWVLSGLLHSVAAHFFWPAFQPRRP